MAAWNSVRQVIYGCYVGIVLATKEAITDYEVLDWPASRIRSGTCRIVGRFGGLRKREKAEYGGMNDGR